MKEKSEQIMRREKTYKKIVNSARSDLIESDSSCLNLAEKPVSQEHPVSSKETKNKKLTRIKISSTLGYR